MSEEIQENVVYLKERWEKLKRENSKLRIRDAAEQLGVSEVELLATDCGNSVTRLTGDWKKLIKRMPELGRVMVLTRNEYAVHEKTGRFEQVEFFGEVMGQVVGTDVDLRIFMNHWHSAFAKSESTDQGTKRSMQFFNQDGSAVFKIFLKEDSNWAAFETIVEEYKSDDQSAEQLVKPLPVGEQELADSEIDVEGLRKGWRELKDTHGFFGLTKKYKVGRVQALRLADDEFVKKVEGDSLRKVLTGASELKVEIMIFVGNPGNIQIHTGAVDKVCEFNEWYNVLDSDFNLHVRENGIANAFVVKKPTKDGIVTSLELYDKNDENILLMFGKRKPGQLENEQWRNIVNTI
ncbi:MAG: ChuX/HutX family heme-like substrate-binding protein [Verrucomicrobiota bacterium]